MELRDYLRIGRRRWALILVCMLVSIAGTALVTLRMTPHYESTARLFVTTPQGDTADAYTGGMFSQERVLSYASLITGERVAQRVIDRLGLQRSPNQLTEQLTSSVAPDTVILEVSTIDPNPQVAQSITAAVAAEFTGLVTELEKAPGKKRSPIKATVVDAADLPNTPVSPQPLRNVGLAAILGLLVGIAIAVLRETLDTTLKSADDVNAITGTSLLGTIRYDASATQRPLITSLNNHAPRVEAFRVLRTNLQFVDVDRSAKTIVVTSSLPEEGKTTTAANLAIALTQSGYQVALVEADLRRPKIATYLRLESSVGVTTILIGRLDCEDATQTWDHRLTVLTSGAIPPNPAELLQSNAMRDLLDNLQKRYDVIIVDAPPLLPVTDAALLTAQADGALLVVRHGKTTRDELQQATERISAVGGRMLGTVLNMAPVKGPDAYGYGYGYAPEEGRRRSSESGLQEAELTGRP
ncbi:MAG: polysaccharide biosynthesis tyrosine autokinase [Nocardioidaceae bacterium]